MAEVCLFAFLQGFKDVTYSAELVSSTTLPTIDDIQEDQSNDDDGKMKGEESLTRTNMTAGVVEESQLVGRDREKELIANLISGHCDKHLEVIAVWGMGGIGKTTLIADVYQRQELNEKFTKRAFVTVLRPFKLQNLLKSIAIQLSGKKDALDFAGDKEKEYALMSVGDLIGALERLSQGSKCLIVVDDLLHTNEWDVIAEAFGKIKNASWTIVITTRQKDIAEHCCKKQECIRMLDLLNDKEAHKLFVKTVRKNTHMQFISIDNAFYEHNSTKIGFERRCFTVFCKFAGKKLKGDILYILVGVILHCQ